MATRMSLPLLRNGNEPADEALVYPARVVALAQDSSAGQPLTLVLLEGGHTLKVGLDPGQVAALIDADA